jgi:hypothetical protein
MTLLFTIGAPVILIGMGLTFMERGISAVMTRVGSSVGEGGKRNSSRVRPMF